MIGVQNISPTSSLSSISSLPTPISSISSTSSISSNPSPSPIPISPPSPALNAIRSTPTPTQQAKINSLPPPPTSSGRSISPSIVPLPITTAPSPLLSSVSGANYSSSNVLYSETKQYLPPTKIELEPRKPDTSDDAFFTQMGNEKKRKEEDDEIKRKKAEKEAEELEKKKALQQFAQQLQQQQHHFQQHHHPQVPSPIPQPHIPQPQLSPHLTQPQLSPHLTHAPPQYQNPQPTQQQQSFQQNQQFQYTQQAPIQSQPLQPQLSPQIHVTPVPQIQTSVVPSVEREKEKDLLPTGMLQKPPPGRDRARSDVNAKNKRDEQMRIIRELSQSPNAYPSSPTSSGGPTGNGSAPTTPLTNPSSPFNPNMPPSPSSNYNAFPISPPGADVPRISPHISSISGPVNTSFPSFPTNSLGAAPVLPQHKTSPNLSSLSRERPLTKEASPVVSGLPAVNPVNVAGYEQPKKAPSNYIDLLSLEDPVPIPQETEEKRFHQDIEKRVREELEEKHRLEIEQLRKTYESQKVQDSDSVGRLTSTPPSSNRARSASHGASNAPGRGPPGRSLPPAPVRPAHPQNPSAAAVPSHASAFSLAPPALSPPGQAPPSPSLNVDSATKERRAQVRKDLASIITKPPNAHPHPGRDANSDSVGKTEPFAVSFPHSNSVPANLSQHRPAEKKPVDDDDFDFDSLRSSKLSTSSVACPICGDSFQNERVLAVHIDDSHGLGSVIGPSGSGKRVHFASGNPRNSGGPGSIERPSGRNALNSSIDALDLSFSSSPLGKSRSVDDIRTKKDDNGDFGFEDFGVNNKPKPERPKTSRERDPESKERTSTLRGFFGRGNRDRDNGTPTPTSSGGSTSSSGGSQIVDLADFMGGPLQTPNKSDSIKSDSSTTSSGSGFFGKKSKAKGDSLGRTPAPRPSILDADLITGSPRPTSLDFSKMGDASKSKTMLMPRKKKKKDFVPFTEETAALKIQSTYRMMVVHKEYRRIVFRTKVAKELVTTEHTYVESIENAIKTFAVPLRQMAESGKPLISMEDISTMFSRMEDILTINRALLAKLTMRIAKWNVVQKIGDVCVDVLSNPINGLYFGKVYNDYTITYNNILETLDRCCREKSAFKRFVQNGEKAFWGSAGNTIQAFFILPVQRITRYILLFKEVIKFTNPSHPDYNNLATTLKEMECVCIDVNENQRKEDTEKKRVQTLQQIQGKIEPRVKDLMVEGRYLLREGVISQFDVDDDQIKERYYFLFNDILLVTKKSKQKYLMRLHITLHNVRLKDIPDCQNFLGHQIANAFEMHTPSKTVMFLAQTVEDKEVVLKELTEVVSQAGGVTG